MDSFSVLAKRRNMCFITAEGGGQKLQSMTVCSGKTYSFHSGQDLVVPEKWQGCISSDLNFIRIYFGPRAKKEFVALGPCMSCFRIYMKSKVIVWLHRTWRWHTPGPSVRKKEEKELSFECFQYKSSMSSDLD